MRTRVGALAVVLCATALALVITTGTLSYRSHLEGSLTKRLTEAAWAVARSGSAERAKEIERGLALEGIATSISGPGAPGSKSPGPGQLPVGAGVTSSRARGVRTVTVTLRSGAVVRFSASEAEITRSVRELLLAEVGAAVACLVLLLVLVRWATSVALRPLSSVIETASAIAAGDRWRRAGEAQAVGEVAALAAAFDRMVDALEKAVDEARCSEEAMRRFLADAAHELRTPVASLHALAERLLREQPERPWRDELEGALAAGSRRLGRLVGDLLTLARLDGSAPAEAAVVDLAEVVAEGVAIVNARQGGVTTLIVGSEPSLVLGERDSLLRLLRNLLENALSVSSVPVSVTLRCDGGLAHLTVHDSGSGIPAGDRERVFERFVRLAGAPAGGSGLGLPIARQIARLHGGDLVCEDVPAGCSFTATLPLARSRERGTPAATIEALGT